MTKTTTIRVSRQVHGLLSEQARERRLSLAGYLSELARRQSKEVLFAEERRAAHLDGQDPAVMAEYAAWQNSSGDAWDRQTDESVG
ncbi:MAG: hypothetical protein LBG11_09850 [Bifidobacteriaceae bacterium]|jgi:hypothetical protein|nr:hypothetical protein [Bifidobacteriaceae bacterium]